MSAFERPTSQTPFLSAAGPYERERYRYQKFCSDISGQDIRAPGNNVATAIAVARN